MNADALIAIANGIVQLLDPGLRFQLSRAEDPESEDDEFELRLGDVPLRHQTGGEEYGYSIQICTFGGGYSANRYFYVDGELDAMASLYDGSNIRAAAHAIADALEGKK